MDNKHKIYNFLKVLIKNEYGVCGLMGNLQAESALESVRLQTSYCKKLGMTSEEYTYKVDDGSYGNFIDDKAGYGLAQWTYKTRKSNLLNFAREKKASIGSLDMQLEFLAWELKGYKDVWAKLISSKTVREASDAILLGYEKPRNQSEENCQKRAALGEVLYDELVAKTHTGENSPLVDVTIYSPNHSGKRTHAVDTITPHCVVGQVSVERLGEIFLNTTKNASCNYGIGADGRVLLCVDEINRSWCTSSNANDQRAITIECASDSTSPYAFNTAVYNKLIDLCVDICKRHNKKNLIWIEDKDTALAYNPKANEMILTVHRWFANKSCPGDWMYSRMAELAKVVTETLGGKPTPTPSPTPVEPYRVRISIDNLNIRTGPGTNYPKTGKATGRGVFTIVEESPGEGSASGWGKLKSGAGWISLDYVTKL